MKMKTKLEGDITNTYLVQQFKLTIVNINKANVVNDWQDSSSEWSLCTLLEVEGRHFFDRLLLIFLMMAAD